MFIPQVRWFPFQDTILVIITDLLSNLYVHFDYKYIINNFLFWQFSDILLQHHLQTVNMVVCTTIWIKIDIGIKMWYQYQYQTKTVATCIPDLSCIGIPISKRRQSHDHYRNSYSGKQKLWVWNELRPRGPFHKHFFHHNWNFYVTP